MNEAALRSTQRKRLGSRQTVCKMHEQSSAGSEKINYKAMQSAHVLSLWNKRWKQICQTGKAQRVAPTFWSSHAFATQISNFGYAEVSLFTAESFHPSNSQARVAYKAKHLALTETKVQRRLVLQHCTVKVRSRSAPPSGRVPPTA